MSEQQSYCDGCPFLGKKGCEYKPSYEKEDLPCRQHYADWDLFQREIDYARQSSNDLIVVFGNTGTGKTGWLVRDLIETYLYEGDDMRDQSCTLIEQFNHETGRDLTLPDRPPIYANFGVKYQMSMLSPVFEPYFINGYLFGMPEEGTLTQYEAPVSAIYLDEAEKYSNSRKNDLPDNVTYKYAMRRHFRLKIRLALPRAMLLDKNIKEVTKVFIEIIELKHDYDIFGEICKSTWKCREFNSWAHVVEYLDTGEGIYKETEYTFDGNIYDCYDSHNYFKEFLPPPGKDFSYYVLSAKETIKGEAAKIFNTGKPKKATEKSKDTS